MRTAEVDQVQAEYRAADRALAADIAQLQLLAQQGKDAAQRRAAAKATQGLNAKAASVLNQISEQSHNALLRHIEQTVTAGLSAIFGEGMALKLTQSTHGKLTTTNLTITSDGMETDVLSARGGGVAATVGLLLRMVLVILDERLDKILILDETLAQVSSDYEEPLADFVQDLARSSGLQLIIITHSDAFDNVADTKYRLALVDGRAVASTE